MTDIMPKINRIAGLFFTNLIMKQIDNGDVMVIMFFLKYTLLKNHTIYRFLF